VLPPASGVAPVDILAQAPVGQGVVTHSMLSEIQPHRLAVSAAQESGWSCTEQGSGGAAPQPQGAQAVFARQAGQPHTDTGADPPSVLTDADAVLALEGVTVIVVAEPPVHEQLQAGQATPAGQTGQLQVQVPDPPLPPVLLLVPVPVPQPPVPPVPPPQLQSQGGQYSPGAHTGQAQVQVPAVPLPMPPSLPGGGGQSHWTGGQDALAQ
jgi:hypothetical protein